MNTATLERPRADRRRTHCERAMRKDAGGLQTWCVYSANQSPSGVTFHPWLVIESVPVGRVLTRGLLRQAGFKFDEWAAPWCITLLTEATPRALLQRVELQDVTKLSWQILLERAKLSARKALIYAWPKYKFTNSNPAFSCATRAARKFLAKLN